MRRLATAVLLVLLALLIAVPASADAHVSEGRNWYWYLGTRSIDSGRVLDPLNVVLRDGRNPGRATPDEVRRVVRQFWRGRAARGQMNSDQVCLGQGRVGRNFGDGRQRAVFKGDRPGGARLQDRPNDYQMSTSNRCFSQYHMRFWDDPTHDAITRSHGVAHQWNIAGVHRDVAACARRYPPRIGPRFGGCHQISGRWVGYRNYALRGALRTLCTKSRWRQYPGGDMPFQGHPFDGYIGVVELTSDASGCPPGLA